MKTMTVRDVRLHWPEAEKALAQEGEIVVTRDSRPVAKIVAYVAPVKRRQAQFDADQHLRWLQKFWKNQPPQPSTDELLRQDREDRHS